MVRVIVIGSGNVARHLGLAFLQSPEIDLVQWYARDIQQLEDFAPQVAITDELSALLPADLYLIAISDDAISAVTAQLPFTGKFVAHTSGSVAISDAANVNRRGVFYPLQTFSKSKTVDFRNVPVCLEAESTADYQILEKVARSISDSVYMIDSSQRKALHVAAVFVSNFANHLYNIGNQICAANNIPFDILKPLIRETADKVMILSPADAQTGPARRRDATTIGKHLDFLSDPDHKKIYDLLTHSIQNGQKL